MKFLLFFVLTVAVTQINCGKYNRVDYDLKDDVPDGNYVVAEVYDITGVKETDQNKKTETNPTGPRFKFVAEKKNWMEAELHCGPFLLAFLDTPISTKYAKHILQSNNAAEAWYQSDKNGTYCGSINDLGEKHVIRCDHQLPFLCGSL